MEDKRGKVTEVDGFQHLGRSKKLSCIRRDISVCVMVVVYVVVEMLVRVMGLVCLGARFLSVVERECLGVDFWLLEGDIFELGGRLR